MFDQISDNERIRLEGRLRRDAARWRETPSAGLRRHAMAAIGEDSRKEHSPTYLRAPRGSALLAACLCLLVASIAALQLQPRSSGARLMTETWPDLVAQYEEVKERSDKAHQLLVASSLKKEATAIAADVRAISVSVRRRLPWGTDQTD